MRTVDDVSRDKRRQAVVLVEAAREARHMSMRQAANSARISDAWWRRLAKGEAPSVSVLLDMARAVGVEKEITEILGLIGEPFEALVRELVRAGHEESAARIRAAEITATRRSRSGNDGTQTA